MFRVKPLAIFPLIKHELEILILFHIALALSLLALYSDLAHPSCSPVTSVTFKTIHKPVSEGCTVYEPCSLQEKQQVKEVTLHLLCLSDL